MTTHVSTLETLANNLRQTGESISDKILITKVLMSFRARYKYFLSVYKSILESDQKLNMLISRLLTKEERLNTDDIVGDQIVLLNYKKWNTDCIKCDYCKGTKHLSKIITLKRILIIPHRQIQTIIDQTKRTKIII